MTSHHSQNQKQILGHDLTKAGVNWPLPTVQSHHALLFFFLHQFFFFLIFKALPYLFLLGADGYLPHSHQVVCVASKQCLAISRPGQRGTLGRLCLTAGKKYGTLHEFACHPCAGAMLIFSVSFQFQYMCCRSEHSSCPSLPTKHTKLPSVPQLPKFILSVSCSLCLEVSLPRSLGDWFLLIFQISQLKKQRSRPSHFREPV